MPSLVRNTSVGGSTTNVTGLNCTSALTVAIWVKCHQGTSVATDILRHASTANNARDGYRIGINNTEFRLDILGPTGSNNYAPIQFGPHRDAKWHHYVVTFSDAANEMFGYVDGVLRQRTAATQGISANASCTTIWNPNVIGSGSNFLFFDLQILPDVVVPAQDVPLLMDPAFQYPGVKGRYFGRNFRTTAAGTGACRDESGNGNHLTISPSAFQQGEEPPIRPTFG